MGTHLIGCVNQFHKEGGYRMTIIDSMLKLILGGMAAVFNGFFAMLPSCYELTNLIDNIKEYFIAEILGVSPEFIHVVFILFSIVAIISGARKLASKLQKTI